MTVAPGAEVSHGPGWLPGAQFSLYHPCHMSKRRLRIVKRSQPPLAGVCEACSQKFFSMEALPSRAEWRISQAFARHICQIEPQQQEPVSDDSPSREELIGTAIHPSALVRNINARLSKQRKVIVKTRYKEASKGEYAFMNLAEGTRHYLDLNQLEELARELDGRAT